jgi:hypothetical protein
VSPSSRSLWGGDARLRYSLTARCMPYSDGIVILGVWHGATETGY